MTLMKIPRVSPDCEAPHPPGGGRARKRALLFTAVLLAGLVALWVAKPFLLKDVGVGWKARLLIHNGMTLEEVEAVLGPAAGPAAPPEEIGGGIEWPPSSAGRPVVDGDACYV
jgi:hypothetical protein